MPTEFDPMEGLLADLLSTWDEEPTAVPEADPPVPSSPAVSTATDDSLPAGLPVMVEEPVMVDESPMVAEVRAEVRDPVSALPNYLPEPACAPSPVRFVSALTKPIRREPIFLDPAEVKATREESTPLFESSDLVPTNSPVPTFADPAPVALQPEATAVTILSPEDRAPVWSEDAGAAAACAAILARMEREFAQREPVVLPVRKTRMGSDAPRYVVFVVRDMFFAVPIGRVLETDRMTPVTPLPGAAIGVKGLTNLRGDVVPVIDLRDLLGWAPPANPTSRRMLVIQDGNRQPLTALLVDQVKGLAAFPATAWKSAEMAGAPGSGISGPGKGAEGFVEAVTERDGEWVSRLNLDRVLNETHLPSLAAA